MSASSNDLPDLKSSDTPDEATFPLTSNDEVPTAKPTEHLHHPQGEGNKLRDVGELGTSIVGSPITKGGYAVSRLANATHDTNKVPITASEELDVFATENVEHTEKTGAENVEGQKKREAGEKGEYKIEEKGTVAGNNEGREREGNEEGEAKREIESEEETDGATDSESSLSTIDSDELDELAQLPRKTDDAVAKHQQRSAKYARVTGSYVEGLEARVGMLESHVRKLQTLLKPNQPLEDIKWVSFSFFSIYNQRRLICSFRIISASTNNSSGDSAVLNEPCDDSPPLKIMRLTAKDWKTRDFDRMHGEACVVLGFADGSKFLPIEPVRSSAQPGSATHARVDVAEGYKGPKVPSDMVHPNTTEVERFLCTSPWVLVVIRLLSDERLDPTGVFIYPFKHLLVYHEQIRHFVKLLEEIDLNSLKARDMLQTLQKIVSQVASSPGPKQIDFDLSDTSVENTFERMHWHPRHKKKLQQSPAHVDSEKAENTKPVAEAFMNRPERAQVGQIGLDNNDTVGGCNESVEVLGHKHLDPTCTCLRDARDHLKLVIDVIDGDLAGLMTLRQAISDRSLRKIRFKDLWNLFQPGDLVVTSKRPHQAFRVIFVSGGRPLMTSAILVNENDTRADFQDVDRRSKVSPFRIDCVRFGFDGKNYGPVQEEVNINHYDEEKEIVELEVYPIRFADDEMGLRQNLIKRGKHFTTYREFKHKWYAGLSLSGRLQEVSNTF